MSPLMPMVKECPNCQRMLGDEAPQGLCPVCLLDMGIEAFQAQENDLAPLRLTRTQFDARYELRELIGAGGMGEVYVAHDRRLDRQVALKLRRVAATSTVQDSPETLGEQFFQEARLTARLDHLNIMSIHELGLVDDGTAYYAMKLVHGESLAARLNHCEKLQERLALLPQYINLCQAMAFAHDQGVIHRDIKPANVMVGNYGETLVIDWGLALDTGQSADDRRGRSGEDGEWKGGEGLEGTLPFLPPEQVSNGSRYADARSDVYALGVVLYTLLTGRLPFTHRDVEALKRQIYAGDAPEIPTLEPKAPRELVAICMRAMHPQPEQRYRSATELLEDLQRFQTGTLVEAYEYGLLDRVARVVRRNKAACVSTAIAVGVVVVAVAAAFYAVNSARTQERLARIEIAKERDIAMAAEAETERARRELATALVNSEERLYLASIHLAAARLENGDPSGVRNALKRAPARLRGWEWGYLRRAARIGTDQDTAGLAHAPASSGLIDLWRHGIAPEPVVQIQTGELINALEFNPDGTRIVSASTRGMARIWDTATGEVFLTLQDGGPMRYGARFSPSGDRVATFSHDGAAVVWDSAAGKRLQVFAGHSAPVYDGRFSPGGKRLVTASHDRTAAVWEVATGRRLLTLYHDTAVMGARFTEDGEEVGTVSIDGNARHWDSEMGTLLYLVAGPNADDFYNLRLSPDVRLAASTTAAKEALVWDAKTGALQATLSPTSRVVEFLGDGSGCGTMAPLEKGGGSLWSLAEGICMARFDPSAGGIHAVAFSRDGGRLATATPEGVLAIWKPREAPSQAPVDTLEGHEDIVFHAAFSPDGTRLATASYDATAKIWDVATGRELATLGGHEFELVGVQFSKDGTRIYTIGWAGEFGVWDAATYEQLPGGKPEHTPHLRELIGSPRTEYALHTAGILDDVVSPDDSYFVLPTIGNDLQVWSRDTGKLRHNLSLDTTQVTAWAFSKDGDTVLTGGMDGATALWNPGTGQEIQRLEGHTGGVVSADFHPHRPEVVTASMEGAARVWDTETGAVKHILDKHTGMVVCADYDRTGEIIITTSLDTTARTWDAASGDPIATFKGHSAPLICAELNDAGDRLLTAAADSTIRIWTITGSELLRVPVQGNLTYAAWGPRGDCVVTTTRNGAAKLWRAYKTK